MKQEKKGNEKQKKERRSHIPTLDNKTHKKSLAPWLLARAIYFVYVRKQEEQKNRIYRLSFPLPNITTLFPSLHP